MKRDHDAANPTSPPSCACWSRSLGWDFVLPFGIVVVLTLFLALGDRELAWHKTLYDFQNHAWTFGDAPFWKFLYRATATPAFLIVLLATLIYIASFKIKQLGRYRKVSIYLVLLVALAPGVIANLILKDHWGRPRPRDITPFDGHYAYESVLAPDPSSTGRSFVCGHATMAFYFIGGWFLLRKRHRRWAYACLFGGIAFGSLVGYMRMLQGGHFATDVLWAGAVTYFTAAALFYLLGLHRDLLPDPFVNDHEQRKIPLGVKLAGSIVIIAMLGTVLLATPYKAQRHHVAHYDPITEAPLKIRLTTLLGDVTFVAGKNFSIRSQAIGHGVPTSGINVHWKEDKDPQGITTLRYRQKLSGWFSEIEQNLTVTVPWQNVKSFHLSAGPGKITFELPRPRQAMTFRLQGDRYSHFEIRLLDDAVLWIPESEKIKVSHQNPKSQLLRIGGDHPKVSHLITLRRLKEDQNIAPLHITILP